MRPPSTRKNKKEKKKKKNKKNEIRGLMTLKKPLRTMASRMRMVQVRQAMTRRKSFGDMLLQAMCIDRG